MDSLKRLVGVSSPNIEGEDKIDVELRECEGRAFLTSLSVWPLVFGAFYFGQKHFGRLNPRIFTRRTVLGSSWLFSLGSAYLIWQAAYIDCQKTAGQKREAVKRKLANPIIS